MKITIVALLLTISAAAQMTNAALLKLDREFAQVTASEHLDGWMRYMTDSTVIFGPEGYSQIAGGKDAIAAYYRDLFSRPDFRLSWKPMSAQLLPTGTTGYTTGTFHWVMPNNQCRCVNDWHGTYLAVWESYAGGKWRLKALFPSETPPQWVAVVGRVVEALLRS